nr:pyridoxal-phosphate dependent enzyme [Croceivirga thetidis]
MKDAEVSLTIKREDLLHPIVSGNKFRKLKYNLLEAKELGKSCLLTFGGAYSNHILATAAAANQHGLKSIGVIRGEELKGNWFENPTLRQAKQFGMEFFFVNRDTYRLKDSESFLEKLNSKFGDFYLLPEGGTNNLAIKGCEEILERDDKAFDFVCTSVGTGGTMAGIINASHSHQYILGFSALKGEFLKDSIANLTDAGNWKIIDDYHFGGYAKVDLKLIEFINSFKAEFNIPLDPIYTGKLFYGLFDLIKKGYFRSKSKILVIHTGGLQGISGMNTVLKKKNLPLLKI